MIRISLAGVRRIAIASGSLAVILCGLQACASWTRIDKVRPTAPQDQAPTNDDAALDMPAFPGETPVGNLPEYRHTSAGQIIILGTQKAAEGGTNNYPDPDIGGAYVIIPGGDDDLLAYARYDVAGLDLERPVSLDLRVTAAPIIPGGDDDLPLNYFVGVGDYTREAWEWHGPYTTATPSIDLNEKDIDILDRYISATHAMRIVIATYSDPKFATLENPVNPLGLTAARIEMITVNTLGVNDPAYNSTRSHYAGINDVGPGGGGKKGSALDPDTQYVHLTWTHVFDINDPDSEAISYKVYRQGPGDATIIPIGSIDAPGQEYIDPTNNVPGIPDPEPGSTYKYALRAYNDAGWTPFSEIYYTIPIQQPPAAPVNVQATDGVFTDRVTITWDAVLGADFYRLLRATDAAGPYTPEGMDVTAPTLTVDDLTANPGVQYWYRVVAGNEVGLGVESTEDGGWRKLSPTTVACTLGTANPVVGLTWTDVAGATDYIVYRSDVATDIGTIVQPSVNDIAWDDHPPLLGENYYYTVVPNCPLGSADVAACLAQQSRGWSSPPKPPTDVHAADHPSDPVNKWRISFTRPSPRDGCLNHLFYYVGATPPDGHSMLWVDTGGQTASSTFDLDKVGYPSGQIWFAVQVRSSNGLDWDIWDFNSSIIPSDVAVNN